MDQGAPSYIVCIATYLSFCSKLLQKRFTQPAETVLECWVTCVPWFVANISRRVGSA